MKLFLIFFFYLSQIFFDLQLCYLTGGRPAHSLINLRGYLKKPTEINRDFSLQSKRREKKE